MASLITSGKMGGDINHQQQQQQAPAAAAAVTAATAVVPCLQTRENEQERKHRETIVSDKELFECDFLPLHLIGKIQGQTAHVIFVSFPLEHVIAVDANILDLQEIIMVPPDWSAHHNTMETATATTTTATSTSTSDSSSSTDTIMKEQCTTTRRMLGTSLQAWLPPDVYQALSLEMKTLKRDFLKRSFWFGRGHAFTLSTVNNGNNNNTSQGGIICIEIEAQDPNEATDSYVKGLQYMSRLLDFYANDTIVKLACDSLFEFFPQFERGMVYRFNDDLSGEIIHEVIRPESGLKSSYLGQSFPKYDIPQSTRELYKKNTLRYIRDATEPDVPILSKKSIMNNSTGDYSASGAGAGADDIDLTQVRCRACAKPHLIYMQNMGVRSSMSMAIIVEGELWGLFAFHGYSQPFKPSLHQRISCETIASMVSVRVESLVRKSASARIVGIGETLIRWTPDGSVYHNLERLGQELLEFMDANVLVGNALDDNNDQETIAVGDESLVPRKAFWDQLMAAQPSRHLVSASTRAEIDAMGITEEDCPANGFVYFREGTAQIFVGRAMRSRDVKWLGSPDEPKLRINGILNPRNSFEMFLEQARKESKAWSTADLQVILVFKDRFCSGQQHEWMTALLRNDIEEANMRYFSAMDRASDNSDFFAHMCHELRTPFHGVMASLQILHDSLDNMSQDEMTDMIKTALSSGNHMIILLNDILNKSKNKYLLTKPVLNPVNYATLTNEAFDSLKALAVATSISLKCQAFPDDNPDLTILTDRTKIIQIVSNIVNNGMKFSGTNGELMVNARLKSTLGEVIHDLESTATAYEGFVFSMEEGKMLTCINDVADYVKSKGDDQQGENHCWISFSVSDTGCGMKPTELAEMFEPYTQGREGHQHKFVGTGLGLFICVSLCHHLGGFMSSSSTFNQGTNFFVAVPVEIVVKDPGSKCSEEEAIIGEEPTTRIPVYGPILIVDDNKVNVKVLHRQLEHELKKVNIQVELISAGGGEAALQLYKSRLPSVLIIDYHMPHMDGVETTRAIRKYELEHDLHPCWVMSYTADASDKAKELLLACGSNEIMYKPPLKGFIKRLVRRMDVTSLTEIMTNYRR